MLKIRIRDSSPIVRDLALDIVSRFLADKNIQSDSYLQIILERAKVRPLQLYTLFFVFCRIPLLVCVNVQLEY